MKIKHFIIFAMSLFCTAANAQTDTLYTQSGKAVVITPIKHASMRIQYDGKEIEIDPVTQLPPVTDYTTYPKADYIFVTHEHFDHCDKKAVQQLTKDETILIANANSANIIGTGEVMKNGDSKELCPKILYSYHFSDTKIERVKELLEDSGIEVRIRNFK